MRERLTNRRASESFTFELDGLHFTATVSRFPDGRIGELFLNNHKAGNQVDTNARDAAILLSFALQHGADIDAIRKSLCRDSRGRALGPIGADWSHSLHWKVITTDVRGVLDRVTGHMRATTTLYPTKQPYDPNTIVVSDEYDVVCKAAKLAF